MKRLPQDGVQNRGRCLPDLFARCRPWLEAGPARARGAISAPSLESCHHPLHHLEPQPSWAIMYRSRCWPGSRSDYDHLIGVNLTTPDILHLTEAVARRCAAAPGNPCRRPDEHVLTALALGANGFLSSEAAIAPQLCQSDVITHYCGEQVTGGAQGLFRVDGADGRGHQPMPGASVRRVKAAMVAARPRRHLSAWPLFADRGCRADGAGQAIALGRRAS